MNMESLVFQRLIRGPPDYSQHHTGGVYRLGRWSDGRHSIPIHDLPRHVSRGKTVIVETNLTSTGFPASKRYHLTTLQHSARHRTGFLQETIMETKPFYASKTLWINIVALVGSILAAKGWDLGLTPEVQGSVVAGIMAVVNIVLRFTTKSAVTGS